MTSEVIGRRIRALRETKGLSRRELAAMVGVDATALASWELGKYLPRDGHRKNLSDALGASISQLFSDQEIGTDAPPLAVLTDTFRDLPELLMELLSGARVLRALRIAAPYATPSHVQEDFRREVSERILARTLEVQRIEVFYSLDRLKESLSNILRYSGCAYNVKCFCTGMVEVSPAMGGYFFDDTDFLVGAYWTGVPPNNRPGLRLSGEPFTTYFEAYWDEIWRRGTLLNMRGANDLAAVRTAAFALGLPPEGWSDFVEEARYLDVGDGAPPLI